MAAGGRTSDTRGLGLTDKEFMAKWQKALPVVRRAVVKAGVPFVDVDDVVQNAFIKAWSDNATRELSLRDGFRARCRAIAYNAAVDYQRKFGREVVHDEIEAASPVNIEHEVEQRERARFVREVIAEELPDKQREAVLKRDELSDDPKVRKSQIASLARARRQLGDRLKDFGVVAPFLVTARRRVSATARRTGPVGATAGALAAVAACVSLLPDPDVSTSHTPEVVQKVTGPKLDFPARPLDERAPLTTARARAPRTTAAPTSPGAVAGKAPLPSPTPSGHRLGLEPTGDKPRLLALCSAGDGQPERCLVLPLGERLQGMRPLHLDLDFRK